MTDTEKKRRCIKSLAHENQVFYNTQDGRGVLRALDLASEHRWIYLFELVQNALDAGAKSIALRLAEEDALIFQHDGTKEINDEDVKGLSKIFRSTKGALSVGFMGIGFKSIFRRFGEVRISGWDWTFRYEVSQERGEKFGDVQPDLIGAVTPIWDDTIEMPEADFTTRFEMRRRIDPTADLRSDLASFLPADDRTSLAILAGSGLKRLEVDGQVWELDTHEDPDGSVEATALSETEKRLWQLFPVKFTPSSEAIARFLEHRRIRPSKDESKQVYAEAARPRQVLGVLLLNNDGMPAPPKRGRVYATLPTEVMLPFGLHINADWLLNISRTGLMEIEENAWQRGLVDQIADVLSCFLGWVARTFSETDGAKAAFAALSPPTPEARGLEALLAKDRWLSRLRKRLEDAAVLPVWTEETDTLTFAKPIQVIVPPAPLAEAFKQHPALQPAVLLKGSVLRRDVLGEGARTLLRRAGLIAEMSPQDLENAWADGLENWWEVLPDAETKRRDLLFRVWGAVSKLMSQGSWSTIDLPCVRTVDGTWRSVNEVAFFNEALPSEGEPGGGETHLLIQPFFPYAACRLPESWINALRQRASQKREDEDRDLSQAWDWVENNAKSISLREVIEGATTALASSPTPDWSVLVPLGHWAMHRNRPDLLTYVLVESETHQYGTHVNEALLANPYVERGQWRRHLFPMKPPVSVAYLEQDPRNAGRHKWRDFFEKAGVQGALKVQPIESQAGRWNKGHVAKFLGLDLEDIYTSNNNGYKLLDFDIEELPEPGASKEARAAVAAWLEDGLRALHDKGSRKCEYFFWRSLSETGKRQSAWVAKLSELAWVPCDDGELHRPRDVLSDFDLAREGVPVAKLSPELLSVLQQEGVAFGTAIPEATLVYKLATVGSQLNAEELAELLGEIREQIATDEDGHESEQFEQVVRKLAVPSSSGERIPINRVVQRVGGQLRGRLGGWVLPLERIDEVLWEELKHPDFPYEFPDTTTGEQALAYIRGVWARARSSPERLANEVRDVLPTAYAYCLKDCDEDDSLSKLWDAAVSYAAVFAEGKWIFLDDAENIYLDDLEDRRFLPENAELQIVTGGHLGNSLSDRIRTAAALELPCLSSAIEMKWNETGKKGDPDWNDKFTLICKLLHSVRGEHVDDGDKTETDQAKYLRLCLFEKIELYVKIEKGPYKPVPVNARLDSGVLKIAGRPVQFGADATKELLRDYSFRQRGNLAADLTGMLGAIDNEEDFWLAVEKFRRSFAPDFELPSGESGPEKPVGLGNDLTNTGNANEPGMGSQVSEDEPMNTNGKTTPENGDSNSVGGSFTRDRALAKQEALKKKLEDSLKGEVTPDDEAAETSETNQGTEADGSEGGLLGDEIYRRVAMQYERELGRAPKLGDPRQEGWDIRSVDPEGSERLIEVKGKGCPWEGDEVVELSRAQVHKAFEMSDGQATGSWYLYVVERIDDSNYRVLPIENPAQIPGKWMLSGGAWRMIAKECRSITLEEANDV